MLAGSRSSPAKLLPVGLAAARNFGSFEELATWAPAWNESEIQLGRGRFRGRLVVAHTARIQLALVVRRPGVLCRGTPPPGTRVVGLCLSAGPAFLQGRPFRRGDVPVILGGMPYEFRAPGAHLVFLLAVEELLLVPACGLAGAPPGLRRGRVDAPPGRRGRARARARLVRRASAGAAGRRGRSSIRSPPPASRTPSSTRCSTPPPSSPPRAGRRRGPIRCGGPRSTSRRTSPSQ